MAYEIFTDSSANLSHEMYEQHGIHVLPLRFMLGDDEFVSYRKDNPVDLQDFYRKMRAGSVYTTSLPYPKPSEDEFRSVLDQGKDVLYVGFSSGLSGTYDAMHAILEGLKAEYPDRTILDVDTLAAAAGEGLLLWYAIQMREEGKDIATVHQWLEDNKLNLAHWFTVDDLMYLFRGGRVSRTSAWAGTLLKVKPVLHVDDEGKLIPMHKVRGRKKSIEALFEQMKASAIQPVEDQVIFISHGDCLEDVEQLERLIENEWRPKWIFHNILDPVIGAHSGPGTLALFFLAQQR